jgi:iron complex transport system ATP-binding protein
MNDTTAPLLELCHISVMRGHRTVLQDVTLRVQAGEHVAILGPNGCGKSTLIKTITRELYPLAHEGSSMRIFGQERWNVTDLRFLLGVVANEPLIQRAPHQRQGCGAFRFLQQRGTVAAPAGHSRDGIPYR